ncbi:MAG: OmpH family outer membrane protein [Acetobacter sp.]
MIRFSGVAGLAASALLVCSSVLPTGAHAEAPSQDNKGWFVPKTAQPANPAPHPAHRQAPATAQPMEDADADDGQPRQPPVLPRPDIPTPPELAKAAPPPTAVVGIISVSEVMRQSLAAQQVERELGGRRDALAREVQKQQAGWRDEQQALQAAVKNMSSDQVQHRERDLQTRVMKAQHKFRDQNRIIQEAAQVALGQIERELVQVIQRVAGAHGMNLVLHSEQVALHVDGQDITDEVVTQLNLVLPTVYVPAANEDPEVLAKSGKMPTTESPEQSPVGKTAEVAAPPSVVRAH